jgi:hypothetical protein
MYFHKWGKKKALLEKLIGGRGYAMIHNVFISHQWHCGLEG